jgi:uncharacterized protein (TIGR02231 family)
MKYAIIVLLLSTSLTAGAQTKSLPTSIKSVTIYGDRALVTRAGRTTLGTGAYVLAISGLPASLEDRSVKVSGEAAGAKILDVSVQTTYLDTVPDERVAQLQKKIDELKHQQNSVKYRLNGLQAESQFLRDIKPQPGAGTSDAKAPKYTVEDWQRSLTFMAANLKRVGDEIVTGDEEVAVLQKKIDAAQKQLNEISSRLQRVTKTMLIDIECTKSGDVALSASYVVFNARWTPQYDVRASRDAGTVQLEYRGVVQQSTGEDWSNVDLALSTARPDVGGVKPDLSPWFVTEAQPIINRPMSRKGGAQMQTMMMKESAAAPTPVPDAEMTAMEEPRAELEPGMTSAMYAIPMKSTIPSDNVSHKVGIMIETLPAEFSYLSAPKLSPFVYLKGTVKNTGEYPLLPGMMNVFGDREFIAQSALKAVAPNESFDAYFGVDPSVTIERKLINKETEYTGTFTKNTKLTYHFKLTLENKKKTDVTVGVQDQLPISQNEKIVVEQLEPTVAESPRDADGVVTFRATLKPAEKKIWNLRFSVEYPRDMKVAGLE